MRSWKVTDTTLRRCGKDKYRCVASQSGSSGSSLIQSLVNNYTLD